VTAQAGGAAPPTDEHQHRSSVLQFLLRARRRTNHFQRRFAPSAAIAAASSHAFSAARGCRTHRSIDFPHSPSASGRSRGRVSGSRTRSRPVGCYPTSSRKRMSPVCALRDAHAPWPHGIRRVLSWHEAQKKYLRDTRTRSVTHRSYLSTSARSDPLAIGSSRFPRVATRQWCRLL
jgi:hypothetical protein